MRPTIGEQLDGTCRVLEAVVAPEVAGTPAADVLNGLVKNLRMLRTNWPAVLPFLHWDNETTAAVLMRSASSLPDHLARRIETLDAEPTPDLLDVLAAQERNDELRALLSEAVLAMDAASAAHADIVAHLVDRAGRYPLRSVPAVPRPQPAPDPSC